MKINPLGTDMTTATYLSTDQHWQDEATVYWFRLDGSDYGTGLNFDNEQFGVRESGPESSIVDCDGCPMTNGDVKTRAIARLCVVSDVMRAAQ